MRKDPAILVIRDPDASLEIVEDDPGFVRIYEVDYGAAMNGREPRNEEEAHAAMEMAEGLASDLQTLAPGTPVYVRLAEIIEELKANADSITKENA